MSRKSSNIKNLEQREVHDDIHKIKMFSYVSKICFYQPNGEHLHSGAVLAAAGNKTYIKMVIWVWPICLHCGSEKHGSHWVSCLSIAMECNVLRGQLGVKGLPVPVHGSLLQRQSTCSVACLPPHISATSRLLATTSNQLTTRNGATTDSPPPIPLHEQNWRPTRLLNALRHTASNPHLLRLWLSMQTKAVLQHPNGHSVVNRHCTQICNTDWILNPTAAGLGHPGLLVSDRVRNKHRPPALNQWLASV